MLGARASVYKRFIKFRGSNRVRPLCEPARRTIGRAIGRAINNCRTATPNPAGNAIDTHREILTGRRCAVRKCSDRSGKLRRTYIKVARRAEAIERIHAIRMSLSMCTSPFRINIASACYLRTVTILIYYRRLLEATCHRVLSETAKHLSANNRSALAEIKSPGLSAPSSSVYICARRRLAASFFPSLGICFPHRSPRTTCRYISYILFEVFPRLRDKWMCFLNSQNCQTRLYAKPEDI